ncbi:hypothetical protein HanOQP8_Chr09g0335601 [Helianthus annuus]|nr:hypothetical protein HanOQP8_Chr09g0335601 [Helianthus annuus]
MSLWNSLIDVEKKTKANGGSTRLNRGKKQQLKANIGVAWGKLLSQCPQNPHIVMEHEIFTVGQGHQCDLWISDKSASKSLCSLRHIKSQVFLSKEVHQLLYLKLLVARVRFRSMARFALKGQLCPLELEMKSFSALKEDMLTYPSSWCS